MMDGGRGRKGPSYGITLGTDRYMGAGRGRQEGDNRTSEVSHRLARVTPWAAQNEMEAQTSGGGRWVEELSRWKVTLQLG